jgi:hypothetical protein
MMHNADAHRDLELGNATSVGGPFVMATSQASEQMRAWNERSRTFWIIRANE